MKNEIKNYECTGCGRKFKVKDVAEMCGRGLTPCCPDCGNLLKPNGEDE